VKFLETARVGQECEVKFDLRGREYNGRYYVSLNAWDIRIETAAAPSKPISDEIDDDLPF
jgi:hypothetical protein